MYPLLHLTLNRDLLLTFLVVFSVASAFFFTVHVSRCCRTRRELRNLQGAGFSKRRRKQIESIQTNLILFNVWCTFVVVPLYSEYIQRGIRTGAECTLLHLVGICNFNATNFWLYRLLSSRSTLVDILDDYKWMRKILWWGIHVAVLPFFWLIMAGMPYVSTARLRDVDGHVGLCVDEIHISVLIFAWFFELCVAASCLALFILPLLLGLTDIGVSFRSREIRQNTAKRTLKFSGLSIFFTFTIMAYFTVALGLKKFLVVDSMLTMFLVDMTVKMLCANLTNSNQYYKLAFYDLFSAISKISILRRCSETLAEVCAHATAQEVWLCFRFVMCFTSHFEHVFVGQYCNPSP